MREGFFGFGRRKERSEPKSPEPIKEVEIKKEPVAGRLDTEAELPERSISESKEKPRQLSLSQYRFGKIVQFPDGPILPGNEHHVTGHTSDYPKALILHPSKFPQRSFDSDLSNWDRNPWKEEGGAITRFTRIVDGRPYVVCTKQGKLHEGGIKNQTGRYYTESQMLVISADEWSVAAVPQLADIMSLKPGTEDKPGNLEMITINTEILDKSLPPGWLDESVKELLTRAIEGRPFGIQDWKLSERDFLQKLYYALVCLPEKIARQISFATGVEDVEGKVRMAHGMNVMTKPRKVGGAWKYDDSAGLELGEQYLAVLIPKLESARTPREVIGIANEIPADLVAKVEKNMLGKKS